MMDKNHKIILTRQMVQEYKLKGNCLVMYAYICSVTEQGGLFAQSRTVLADTLAITPPTVDKCFKELLEKGLLERQAEVTHEYVAIYKRLK